MRFTLHYRGQLHASGKPPEKHALRRHFHIQMARLWAQKPLAGLHNKMLDSTAKDQSLNVLMKIGAFTFAPLIAQKTALVAEVAINILRPEPPGTIVTQAGDLDNRLKTLLDALKVPTEANALPTGATPQTDEDPFFCVLEDDQLITRLDVGTDRLLENVTSVAEVDCTIRITTRHVEVYWGTIGL